MTSPTPLKMMPPAQSTPIPTTTLRPAKPGTDRLAPAVRQQESYQRRPNPCGQCWRDGDGGSRSSRQPPGVLREFIGIATATIAPTSPSSCSGFRVEQSRAAHRHRTSYLPCRGAVGRSLPEQPLLLPRCTAMSKHTDEPLAAGAAGDGAGPWPETPGTWRPRSNWSPMVSQSTPSSRATKNSDVAAHAKLCGYKTRSRQREERERACSRCKRQGKFGYKDITSPAMAESPGLSR